MPINIRIFPKRLKLNSKNAGKIAIIIFGWSMYAFMRIIMLGSLYLMYYMFIGTIVLMYWILYGMFVLPIKGIKKLIHKKKETQAELQEIKQNS